ncbi:MAG: hypothetical protein RL199_414 [Pseudomonadota bacterium]|jgi:hypothetical protein
MAGASDAPKRAAVTWTDREERRMKRRMSGKAEKVLVEFFLGVRKLERQRREAGADESQVEFCTRTIAFGLRKTEAVLVREGLVSQDHEASTPSPGEYLH